MHFDPRVSHSERPSIAITALVLPRPIGWISTLDEMGIVNLAPYSFFNAISGRPPFVMFASVGHKDFQRNAEKCGEFVVNLATFDLRDAVNETSAPVPPDVDEAALAELDMVPSVNVRPPRVARSPIALECVTVQTVQLTSRDGTTHRTSVVIGEVVGVYIDENVMTDNRIDVRKLRPLSRLGYDDYAVTDEVFSMGRPR